MLVSEPAWATQFGWCKAVTTLRDSEAALFRTVYEAGIRELRIGITLFIFVVGKAIGQARRATVTCV